MGSEVAVPEETGTAVAPLAYDPATTIDADDVQLPRLKKVEKMSQGAAGELPYGSLYIETGPEDEEPVVIAKAGKGFGTPSESVRFYVVAGPIKGWSRSVGGELESLPYGALDEATARQEKWDKTYKYFVCLPDAEDPSLPFSVLMKRTSTPCARQINTILQKAAQFGPTYEVPFDLTATKKQGNGYEWAVFGASRADVPAKDLAAELEKVEAVVGIAQAKASVPDTRTQASADVDSTPDI